MNQSIEVVVKDKQYRVLSSDGVSYYTVVIHGKQFCGCMDFTQGYSKDKSYFCKHIKLAQDFAISSRCNCVDRPQCGCSDNMEEK